MTANIHLLDTVAVTRDLPEWNLTADEIGAVVEILSPSGGPRSLGAQWAFLS
jgi:hypothetical protein